MTGTFSQGILGDIYNRQIYIGLEEYETKLLTRREIVALIEHEGLVLQGNIDQLEGNISKLNNIASNETIILDAANTSYSLVGDDTKVTLNKTLHNQTTLIGTATYPVYKMLYNDETHTVNFEKNDTTVCSFTVQTTAIFDLVGV
jgi:ribosomal protein S24E